MIAGISLSRQRFQIVRQWCEKKMGAYQALKELVWRAIPALYRKEFAKSPEFVHFFLSFLPMVEDLFPWKLTTKAELLCTYHCVTWLKLYGAEWNVLLSFKIVIALLNAQKRALTKEWKFFSHHSCWEIRDFSWLTGHELKPKGLRFQISLFTFI